MNSGSSMRIGAMTVLMAQNIQLMEKTMQLRYVKIFWQAFRDHSYITSAKGLCGSEKWQFLLTFSTINADVGWVGGSKKSPKMC